MKNTFVKVLSIVMALMMVVGTFSTLAVFAEDKCEHTKGVLVEKHDPTCAEVGYSVWKCDLCGENWQPEDEVKLPSADLHKYEDVDAVEANCLTNAFSAGKKCVNPGCGDVLEGCVEAVGTRVEHQFVATITEADCLNPGKVVRTCKICNLTAEKIKDDGKYMGGQAWLDKYEAEWKEEIKTPALNPDHANLTWTVVEAPKQVEGDCLAGKAEGFCEVCKTVIRTAEIPAIHTEYTLNPENHDCGEYDSTVKACENCHKILTPNADEHKMENAGKHENTTPIFATPNGDYDYETTVDGLSLPEKPEGGKFTLVELKGYGYEVGDTLATEATCDKPGSALVQCECGAIFTKVLEADHDYTGVAYEYNEPKECTQAYTKTRECNNCDYVDIVVLVEAAETECNLVVVPHDAEVAQGEKKSKLPGCTTNGYTYSKCENKTCMGDACTADLTNAYVDAVGHNWSAPVLVSGICNGGVYRKFCTTENCDGGENKAECAVEGCTHGDVATCTMSGDVVAQPETITDCAWGAKVTVAATCHAVAYSYIPCTVCDNEKERADVEGSVVNPDNHVYATDAQLKAFVEGEIDEDVLEAKYADVDEAEREAAYWLGEFGIEGFDKGVASTCTVAGKIHIKCIYCSMDVADTAKTVVAPLKDHTPIPGAGVEKDSNGAFVRVIESAIEMKCDTVGYAADGEYCSVCGLEKKAPTKTTFDPTDVNQINSHKGTVTLYKAYEATCEKAGYSIYDTTCCGRVTVATSDGVAEHRYTKVYGYDDADCLNDGHHAYLGCVWCGKFKTMIDENAEPAAAYACTCGMDVNHLELALVENYIIPALGHDFTSEDAKIPAVRSTCDRYGDDSTKWNKAGTYEYYDCTRCDYTKFGDKVYSDSAEDREAFELAIAEPAHYGKYLQFFKGADATCTENAIIEGTYCTVCEKDAWIDPDTKTNHEGTTVDLPINLVMGEDSQYDILDCTKDTCIVTRCTKCGWYEADYDEAINTAHNFPADWTPVDAAQNQTCYVDSKKVKQCEDCVNGKLEEVTTKATGHYTTKGVTGGEKFFFDYSCNKINDFKDYECDVCYQSYIELLGVNGENVVHDEVKIDIPATCTEGGIYVLKCRNNCNFTDDAFKKYNLESVNITTNDLGGHKPNHEDSVIIEDLAPTLEQDGRFVYVCGVCGETITEIIAASLAVDSVIVPEYEVYSSGNVVNAIVSITADEFSFNTLTIDVISGLKLVDFEMLASFDVNVSAFINADGDVVIFAEDTLTGDYQNATFAGGENVALIKLTFAISKFAAGEYTFATEIKTAEIYNADEEALEAVNLVDADEDETAKITVTAPGNFNGDKNIDARDLASFLPALANAVLSGEVENKYDLNNDGKVDFTDVAGLRAYIADGLSLKSYLAMTGEDVDAALASNAAPVFVDNNGAIINLDESTRKMLFANAMKAVIDTYTVDEYTALCEKVGAEDLTSLIGIIVKLASQEAIEEPTVEYRSIVFTASVVYIRGARVETINY